MADGDSGSVSEDSIAFLGDVKKGKPRKFAMICKGTSVVSLVVFKKGSIEKHKKEAKQAGKGQFYFGVVDGQGQDIRFVLARADGFESAPVKSVALKGFLEESAQLKCKPYFEIVDAAPMVLDSDDPLVARFLQLQEAALRACEAHPERAAEINSLCLQIGGHLDQDQVEQATAKIDQLDLLLQGLGGQPTPSSPSDGALEAKLLEALKKLKPLLEKAIELHPQRKAELLGNVAKAREELKQKQFEAVRASIIGLGKLLQELIAAGSTGSTPSESTTKSSSPTADNTQAANFNERFKQLSAAIKAAAGTPAAEEAKRFLLQAGALAKLQDFAQATPLLDQAEAALSGPVVKSESPVEPTAEPESVFILWRDAREAVMDRLSQLQDALRKVDDQRFHEVADKGLNGITKQLQVGLHVALMEYDRAKGDNRVQAGVTALNAVEEFENFLQSNPLVTLIDKNPFNVNVGLQTDLSEALRRVRDALSA